jgi:putative sugar O-methyltransferase
MKKETQILENPELLKTMMNDMDAASDLYKPTNYWSYKSQFSLPSLYSEGLQDFRRKKHSVYASLGGVDVYPDFWIDLRKSRIFNNRILRSLPLWEGVLKMLSALCDIFLSLCLPFILRRIKEKPYRVAAMTARQNNSKPIEQFEASMVGNPEYVININNKNYTNNIFDYYIRYSYCCRYIDFEKVNVIVELGSGSCKLTEVIKKLHPHISFLNFDIAPQLYIGEMYLKTVFGNDVVGYESNRNIQTIERPEPGKIYFYGSWQFPLLKDFKHDLFFNVTSFQEMEPPIVQNYLQFIDGNVPAIYLHEQMAGKEKAQKEGDFGVMDPVKLEHYIKFLTAYELVNKEDSYDEYGEMKWKGYMNTFWKLKQ